MHEQSNCLGVVRFIRNGVVEEELNLITEDGRLWIAERCAGIAGATPITHVGVGTGTTAAADAQLAAGGGGTFQQGHAQAVGRGFAGAHEARRACPQDEDVRFPGSGV